RLERDHGIRPACELAPQSCQRTGAPRQEADELVAVGREPAGDECRIDSRWTGEHGHGHTVLECRSDETSTGIADPGHTRVADESDTLAGQEPRQELRSPLGLVVLVRSEERRAGDSVSAEQDGGVTG